MEIGTLNNQQTTTLTITAQITGTGTIINTAEETNQDQNDRTTTTTHKQHTSP